MYILDEDVFTITNISGAYKPDRFTRTEKNAGETIKEACASVKEKVLVHYNMYNVTFHTPEGKIYPAETT